MRPPIESESHRWHHRTLNEFSPGSLRSSVFTLSCSAIGAGVLTLPYAISLSGIWPAGVFYCISIMVCSSTLWILSAGVMAETSDGYSHLASMTVSPWLGFLVDLCVGFNGYAVTSALFIFLANFTRPTILAVYSLFQIEAAPPWFITYRPFVLFSSLIIVWPYAVRRELSGLRKITLFPVFALLLASLLVVIEAPINYNIRVTEGRNIAWFGNSEHSIKGFSIILFAYMQHVNACLLTAEMQRPSEARLSKVLHRAIGVETVVYVALGLGGYLSWLDETKQNLMENYACTDPLFAICRIFLLAAMMIGIPVNNIAAGRSVLTVLSYITTPGFPRTGFPTPAELQYAASSEPGNYLAAPSTHSTRELGGALLSGGTEEFDEPFQNDPQKVQRVLAVTLCLFVSAGIALLTDEVATIVAVAGGLISSSLMCLIPALIYFHGAGKHDPPYYRYGLTLSLLAVAMVLYFSVVQVIWQQISRL